MLKNNNNLPKSSNDKSIFGNSILNSVYIHMNNDNKIIHCIIHVG